jgi:hypothetical protein
MITGKAVIVGATGSNRRAIRADGPAGVVVMACLHRKTTQHGKPQRWRHGTSNRMLARDRPGRVG